jgi:hypothetical protein
MNNSDHISESLETIFGVKILKFFDADSGWKEFGSGVETIRIRDKHPGSPTLLEPSVVDPDPHGSTLIWILGTRVLAVYALWYH